MAIGIVSFPTCCVGMGHLHSLDIVHSDLSLNNFQVTNGVVKVADFGTAHAVCSVLPGRPVCTGYVRSPELVLGEVKIASPADVWALGVCMLVLLAGWCPWLDGKFLESGPTEDVDNCYLQLATQVQIFGPITEKTWPRHTILKKWPDFRKLHGSLNHDLAGLDAVLPWPQAYSNLAAESEGGPGMGGMDWAGKGGGGE